MPLNQKKIIHYSTKWDSCRTAWRNTQKSGTKSAKCNLRNGQFARSWQLKGRCGGACCIASKLNVALSEPFQNICTQYTLTRLFSLLLTDSLNISPPCCNRHGVVEVCTVSAQYFLFLTRLKNLPIDCSICSSTRVRDLCYLDI